MPWDDIAVAAFAALAGWAIGLLQSKLADRKQKIGGVVERYVAATQKEDFRDTPASRIYAMQIAGVAALTPKETRLFLKTVVDRGCTYPLLNLDWKPMITEDNLVMILRDASALGHRLVDDKAILDFFFYVVFEHKQPEAQKDAEDSNAPGII